MNPYSAAHMLVVFAVPDGYRADILSSECPATAPDRRNASCETWAALCCWAAYSGPTRASHLARRAELFLVQYGVGARSLLYGGGR